MLDTRRVIHHQQVSTFQAIGELIMAKYHRTKNHNKCTCRENGETHPRSHTTDETHLARRFAANQPTCKRVTVSEENLEKILAGACGGVLGRHVKGYMRKTLKKCTEVQTHFCDTSAHCSTNTRITPFPCPGCNRHGREPYHTLTSIAFVLNVNTTC